MVKERLELDLSSALKALSTLDAQLGAAASRFGEALSRAMAQLDTGVHFTADTTEAQAAVQKVTDETKEAEEQTHSWTASLGDAKKALLALGVAFGIREVLQQLKGAVLAASDLAEALNKSRVIFGDASRAVEAFADTADSIGLARSEALAAVSDFGALFTASGLAEGEAAKLSIRMTTLAADIASINNIPIDEALLRLRAGLVGEAEPLRRIQVLINEATVSTKAYELGIAAAGDELTEGQKVQARYALILEQTTKQQGDFARTADDLANAMRKARARLVDAQISLGAGLLPAARNATLHFRDEMAPALRDLFDPLGRVIGAFAEAGGGALPILTASLRALTPLLEVVATVLEQIPAPLLAAVLNFKALTLLGGSFGKFGAGIAALLPILNSLDAGVGRAVSSVAAFAAIGFQFGGGPGAALGAALGLITSLFGESETAAERLTRQIKALGRASDESVRALARQTAALVETDTLGAADDIRTNLIPGLKEMARQSDEGAGAARRLGEAYVAVGLITEGQLTRAFRNLSAEQQRVAETTAAGSAALATLPTTSEQAAAAVTALATIFDDFASDVQSAFGAQAVPSVQGFIDRLNTSVAEVRQWNADVYNLLRAGFTGLATLVQSQGPGAAVATEIRNSTGKVKAAWDATIQTGIDAQVSGERVSTALAGVTVSNLAARLETLRTNGTAYKAGNDAGSLFGSGIIGGIVGRSQAIQDVVRKVVKEAKKAADDAARNKSPSRLFMEVGANLSAGLERGFAAGAPRFERTVATTITAPASGLPPGLVGALDRLSRGGPQVIVVKDLWEAESRGMVPGGTSDQTAYLSGR